MMNNMLYYFDSVDAQSIDMSVSKDYAFIFMANLPDHTETENHQGEEDYLKSELTKLLRQSESVGFVITDILYYRFLLSISLLFSISDQPAVSGLLISSAEKIFESMGRDDIWSLLVRPNVDQVEFVCDSIITAATADNEVTASHLLKKWKTIQKSLYGVDSDNVLSSFSKSDRLVVPFSLHANKTKLDEIIKDTPDISVSNRESQIFRIYPTKVVQKGREEVFESINNFCDSICTIFSAIFIDGKEGDDLDEAYKSIWAFLLRTKSSCFAPKNVFDKAKYLLL